MSEGAGIGYETVLPAGWSRPRGFAQAVKATGSTVLRVSGQLGRAPGAAGVEAGSSLGTQWRVALENLIAVVRAGGGDIGNIVLLRAYVTDMAEFNAGGAEVGAAWAATLGRHFPAMTLVGVTGLVDPNARVEIEAEAVLA
ncbi:MAG: RidA family protein [Phenylobacterium sp.]|uniref:RidA family protein n=1 Tax=Phenylobacterium sp. TaxID=1871053 RepID=UPI001A479A48|nr:RidA family protein [Phenylobacterium sp.]MBL8774256.1 RidA family protein [Phenylobacterium sp.]